MAYPVFQIGAQTLPIVQGNPETEQQLSELIERPGVDGTSRRLLGLRNKPFTLRSVASVASVAAGLTLMATYAGLIDDGALDFTWRDVAFHSASPAYKVRVLAVRQIRIQATTCMVGNVTGGHTHILEAEWTLQLVRQP